MENREIKKILTTGKIAKSFFLIVILITIVISCFLIYKVKTTSEEQTNGVEDNYYDDTENPNVKKYIVLLVITLNYTGASGFIYIVLFVKSLKTKKIIKKYGKDNLIDELSDNSVIEYKKNKLYFTQNYVISTLDGLKIFEYDDIVWIYINQYNGIMTGNYLFVNTKYGKEYPIAVALRNNIKNLNLIMREIEERKKNILVGFSVENKKAYKEIVKKNKNNK